MQGSRGVYPKVSPQGNLWRDQSERGGIFPELARQKECRIVEGHLLADHVHMGIEIPPTHAVASIIGFLKGKSAVAIARQFGGKLKNFTGEHFWARGYDSVDGGVRAGKSETVYSGTRGRRSGREILTATSRL